MNKVLLFITAAAAASALLLSCDSGESNSGNPAVDNTILNGNFYSIKIGANGSGPYGMIRSTSFNGSGTLTHTTLVSVNTPTPAPAIRSYTGYSDGTVTIAASDPAGGIISRDGNVLSTTDSGNMDGTVELSVAIRKSNELTDAALNGAYIVSQIGASTTSLNAWTLQQEFVSSGTGTISYTIISASSGSNPGTGTYSYTVSDDGALEIDGRYKGAVSSDGNYFMVLDTDASDSDLSFSIGLRKSSGLSNASMSGEFIGNRLQINAQGSATYRFLNVYNGNGTGSYTMLTNGNTSGSFTYALASDGSITADEGKKRGVVSPDADIVVTADTNVPDDGRLFVGIGIKKK